MQSGTCLAGGRRVCLIALATCATAALAYLFSPGLPVLWGPWASAAAKEAGRDLFEHEWQPNDPLAHGDGLGPVFNARSCVACHFQGGVGGAGPNGFNVSTYEIMPTDRNPEVKGGVLHADATQPQYRESQKQLRALAPIVKGRPSQRRVDPVSHCAYVEPPIPDFDPLKQGTVQTTALFGAGWIDRISTRAISHNLSQQQASGVVRELSLDFGGIPAGRMHVLADGRIGKFGWKAQFATLKEFVAAACANELGLGTPVLAQPRPLGAPAYPDQPADLDRKQFGNLVAFVDTLPRPVEVGPSDGAERDRAARGKGLFGSAGCAICHTPDLGGVTGVYSDFLLHDVRDSVANNGGTDGYGNGPTPPEFPKVPDRHPRPNEWKTPPLWGVADSAPYMHDGSARTLQDAILQHGGDAKPVTEAYRKLTAADQAALVAFLKTLKGPADALPAKK
jgi:mono/diheme cytochrome c family protein